MGVAYLEFRGENIRGWLKNHEIHGSFLPRKFPAIRYCMATNVYVENTFPASMAVKRKDGKNWPQVGFEPVHTFGTGW